MDTKTIALNNGFNPDDFLSYVNDRITAALPGNPTFRYHCGLLRTTIADADVELLVYEYKAELDAKTAQEREIERQRSIMIDCGAIQFNTKDRQVVLPSSDGIQIFPYESVLEYELLEDGATEMSGGVGRAVVGGLLFGATGAIVGSTTRSTKNTCSLLVVKLTIAQFGAAYATYISKTVRRDSPYYLAQFKLAQDALSQLTIICNETRQQLSQ